MANPQLGIGNLVRNSAFGGADDPLGGDLLDAYARLQQARGYPNGSQASVQPGQLLRGPLARVDQPVNAPLLSAPRGLDTGTPSVPFDPVTATVNRGATVEGMARDHYGDEWRTGVGAVLAANNLRTNQYGSPILNVGGQVQMPRLDDYTVQQRGQFAASARQTLTKNQARLSEARERSRLASTLSGSRYSGLPASDLPAAFDNSYNDQMAIDRGAAQRAQQHASAHQVVAERFVPRDRWGARPPLAGQLDNETEPYNTITLHHTSHQDTPQKVQSLHLGDQNKLRDWANNLGFNLQTYPRYGDVGYHFMVGRNGEIYQGRALDKQGAHVAGHNSGNIGVAALGDYSLRPLSRAQASSLNALVTTLPDRYPVSHVATHGMFDPSRRDELQGAHSQLSGLLR